MDTPLSFLRPAMNAMPANSKNGVCDISNSSDPNKLVYWRYDTQYLPFTLVGADLVLAANTSIDFFQLGGASGSADTGVDPSTSNALKEGALARQGEQFEVMAMGFQILEPRTVNSSSNIAYSAAISGPSGGYVERLKRGTYDNMWAQATFEDDPCTLDIGLISMLPSHSELTDSVATGNPSQSALGFFGLSPMAMSILSYPRRDSGQMTVTLKGPIGKTITILGDPLQPIPAGITTVYVPVRAVVYGVRECKAPNCAVECDAATLAAAMEILRAQGKLKD